ncbi:MAG TPA: hypothetical protein VHG71_06170 [Verrucomicrobiae bacterium]|nr:hypothetical protein [Verrucomicrobiae bacterium]
MRVSFWINLTVATLVCGYILWTAFGGWQLFLGLLRSHSAEEILKNVQDRRRYFFSKAIGNLVALAFFIAVKAMLILFKVLEENSFSTLIFGGNVPDWNPFNTFGCLGVLLIATSLVCFYQHIKSRHYLDVLYAFREQLGLTELE